MDNLTRGAFFSLIFLAFLVFSCVDTELSSKDAVGFYQVLYLNPDVVPDQLVINDYSIASISPQGDFLRVVVDYSGGCGDHLFLVWWNGEFDDDDDPLDLYLMHDAQGDFCEALVRDTIMIDTHEIFPDDYFESKNDITIRNVSDDQEILVNQKIAELASDECTIPVNMARVDCATGVWGDLQMTLSDTSEAYRNIILQPVSANTDIIPQEGEALVGVEVLFGYNYMISDSMIACQIQNNKKQIPVKVKCIQSVVD